MARIERTLGKILKRELLFPLAAAINFFSITGLLIISGLSGKADLAADIAVTQGALLAVFLALSGNARNIILGAVGGDVEKSLFYFRLILLVPASIAVFYLASSTVAPPPLLLTGLILRKCSEWIAELQLANRELNRGFDLARKYILANAGLFLVLVLILAVPKLDRYLYWILFAWALSPIAFVMPFLRYIRGAREGGIDFIQLMPHMGSTVAIGISTFVFRVLIIILAGKILAGQMFTAYALGGVLSSLYVYAFGPSLMVHGAKHKQALVLALVIGSFAAGLLVIIAGQFLNWEIYSDYYLLAIGLSLIGGGIMILAQSQRLIILQELNRDVFVPDAAANILLISSIPFAFFLFGDVSFSVLFLWSALLHLMLYVPMVFKTRFERLTV